MTKGLKPYLIREIEFIKEPSRTLGTLACIRVLGTAPEDIHLSYPTKMGDVLGRLMLALARDEATVYAGGERVGTLDTRVILVDDEGKEYPFSWLYLYEEKTAKDKRQAHEWMFGLQDGQLTLCFQHGSYGYRENRWYHPDAALLCMSKVLGRKMPWVQFGSEKSQRTLLGKGQFYWQDKLSGEDVPVDNFVFVTDDGAEVTLAGSGGRAVLSVEKGTIDETEWYPDYAEALKRMADVLEGRVDLDQFGKDIGEELSHAIAPGRRTVPVAQDVFAADGKFVVKSIYGSGDVHPAPSLVFKTGQDHRVYLVTDSPNWEVRFGKPKNYHSSSFNPAHRSQALEELAAALAGERWRLQKYQR